MDTAEKQVKKAGVALSCGEFAELCGLDIVVIQADWCDIVSEKQTVLCWLMVASHTGSAA